MKRWWIIVGLVMVLALAACGGDDKDGDQPAPASSPANDSSSAGGAPLPNTPSGPVPVVVPIPTATLDLPAAENTAAMLGVDANMLATGRTNPAPDIDPNLFEAPFSVGQFVRESLRGRASAPQLAGQLAIYRSGSDVIILNVLFMQSPAEAVATARYALEQSDSELKPVFPPIYERQRAFGVSQDRHGGYIAGWTSGPWVFTVRADKSSAALNAFLAFFPY